MQRTLLKKLHNLYGDKALKETQCRSWFIKFHSGDFSLKDKARSSRSSKVDDDDTKAFIESDRHVTESEIGVKHTKVNRYNHIRRLGIVKNLDIWVPHELKEILLTIRFNACDMYLKRNEYDPFWKQIITADEKWIIYSNVNRNR